MIAELDAVIAVTDDLRRAVIRREGTVFNRSERQRSGIPEHIDGSGGKSGILRSRDRNADLAARCPLSAARFQKERIRWGVSCQCDNSRFA